MLAESVLPINGLIDPNGDSDKDRWSAFYANKPSTNLMDCSICNRKHSTAVDCITFNRDHGFQCVIPLKKPTSEEDISLLNKEYQIAMGILYKFEFISRPLDLIFHYVVPQ